MARYKELECKHHGLTIHRQRPAQKGRKTLDWRCKKCIAEKATKRRYDQKAKAIKHLGGKCSICGYDKCNAALEFHHKDPAEKEWTPAKIFSHTWESIKKEIEKCDLLCANCHREIHN